MKNTIYSFLSITAMILIFESKAVSGTVFDQQKICRATIGALMGRDPKIIKVSNFDSGIIHVNYFRPDDGKLWEQRCRIEGKKVIWATKSGRWREHPMDEVVTYTVMGASLMISQKFPDGSTMTKSYTADQLAPN